jgi:hypothetical protein
MDENNLPSKDSTRIDTNTSVIDKVISGIEGARQKEIEKRKEQMDSFMKRRPGADDDWVKGSYLRAKSENFIENCTISTIINLQVFLNLNDYDHYYNLGEDEWESYDKYLREYTTDLNNNEKKIKIKKDTQFLLYYIFLYKKKTINDDDNNKIIKTINKYIFHNYNNSVDVVNNINFFFTHFLNLKYTITNLNINMIDGVNLLLSYPSGYVDTNYDNTLAYLKYNGFFITFNSIFNIYFYIKNSDSSINCLNADYYDYIKLEDNYKNFNDKINITYKINRIPLVIILYKILLIYSNSVFMNNVVLGFEEKKDFYTSYFCMYQSLLYVFYDINQKYNKQQNKK